MADLTEEDGLPALDEVLHSGLLHESERKAGPMTAGRYVFAHQKIRAIVYAEAGEARRRIFHRRALQALQASAVPAADLAYHALSAGLTEPAFHWSLVAGDEAMRVFAVRDALTFYEQARLLLAERWHGLGLLTMLPAPAIEHLYIHLGRAYELNTEPPAGGDLGHAGQADGQQLGTLAGKARVGRDGVGDRVVDLGLHPGQEGCPLAFG